MAQLPENVRSPHEELVDLGSTGVFVRSVDSNDYASWRIARQPSRPDSMPGRVALWLVATLVAIAAIWQAP